MARKKTDHRLRSSKAQAAIARAEALAKGGQQAQVWRSGGVKASITTDRRKANNKRACRGRYKGD